jgi:GT2 family glycosyltransferase
MEFHVIIPAYNEESVIDDCLQSLAAQTFTDFRVSMIDDQSTDTTAEIIQRYVRESPDRFQLHQFGKVGPGAARNRVAALSEASHLVFMDADCRADSDWLSQLAVAYRSKPTAASIGGPHIAPPESNPFQLKVELFLKRVAPFVDFYKEPSGTLRRVRHNPLCNVSYRRDVFIQLNGFRTDLFPGEDFEFDERLRLMGEAIYFAPQALVYHHRPEDESSFKKVMYRYGHSQGRLVKERGPHRLIHYLATPMRLATAVLPSGFSVEGQSLEAIALKEWIRGFSDGRHSSTSV